MILYNVALGQHPYSKIGAVKHYFIPPTPLTWRNNSQGPQLLVRRTLIYHSRASYWWAYRAARGCPRGSGELEFSRVFNERRGSFDGRRGSLHPVGCEQHWQQPLANKPLVESRVGWGAKGSEGGGQGVFRGRGACLSSEARVALTIGLRCHTETKYGIFQCGPRSQPVAKYNGQNIFLKY